MNLSDVKKVRGNGVARSSFDTFTINKPVSKKRYRNRVSEQDADKYRELEEIKNGKTYPEDDDPFFK